MDRLVLLNNIPPQTGDITCVRIIRKLREDLSFGEDDFKPPLSLRFENGNYTWNSQSDPIKDIEFGDKAMEITVNAIKTFTKSVHERANLTEQFLAVIEKFLSDEDLDKIIEEVNTEKKAKEEK